MKVPGACGAFLIERELDLSVPKTRETLKTGNSNLKGFEFVALPLGSTQ
jgi:hypothetical protein